MGRLLDNEHFVFVEVCHEVETSRSRDTGSCQGEDGSHHLAIESGGEPTPFGHQIIEIVEDQGSGQVRCIEQHLLK